MLDSAEVVNVSAHALEYFHELTLEHGCGALFAVFLGFQDAINHRLKFGKGFAVHIGAACYSITASNVPRCFLDTLPVNVNSSGGFAVGLGITSVDHALNKGCATIFDALFVLTLEFIPWGDCVAHAILDVEDLAKDIGITLNELACFAYAVNQSDLGLIEDGLIEFAHCDYLSSHDF